MDSRSAVWRRRGKRTSVVGEDYITWTRVLAESCDRGIFCSLSMRLIEALHIVNAARQRPDTRRFALVCGIQPLHLSTFFSAHLQQRAGEARVDVREGLFGDLLGNVRRAARESLDGAGVVVEWADLDPRLGFRLATAWGPDALPDIVATVGAALDRLRDELHALAATTPVALSLPTLAPPPIAYAPTWQASAFDLSLRAAAARFAVEVATVERLRVVNQTRLDRISPAAARLSVKSDLGSGFPYSHAHAAALAESLALLLVPPSPKKGLITDLDDTLWSGILGEVGVHGVSWDLDQRAQAHGVYQQTLAALAASGVLIAVVSKNDPTLVDAAFARSDLRLARDRIFPILASWNAKSSAVAEVLRLWNVAADSVVFVDDSPLELAEVQGQFPDIECLRFPADDPDSVVALVSTLRDRFGKDRVLADDALRLDSLRNAAEFREQETGSADADAFLAGLGATLTFRMGREPNPRAFELINKTNQFNLNGERYTEAAWRALLDTPGAFVLAVDYADKFGQLGTIAVVTGAVDDGELRVDRWVMSCRAFARRIEHATLRFLFEETGAAEAALAYRPTERNGPTRDFLADFVVLPTEAETVHMSRATFDAACAPTYHALTREHALEHSHG